MATSRADSGSSEGGVTSEAPEQRSNRAGVPEFPERTRTLLDDILRRRLAEPLRIDDLAEAAGYSRFYFLRRFRATYGRTPYRYLLTLRIQAACELLAQPHRQSMDYIANRCGFTRVESFTRAFRQQIGVTPARYAAGHRPEVVPDR